MLTIRRCKNCFGFVKYSTTLGWHHMNDAYKHPAEPEDE